MITILISAGRSKKLIAAVLALALVSCGTDTTTDQGLSVVATTSIWADVAGRILEEDGSVEMLIPRGGDAHDYLPSAREVAAITKADLVVANGLGLEEGLADVLDAARADGVVVHEVGPHAEPLPLADSDDVRHGLDPHVWLDPDRVALAADSIAASLASIEPDIDWQARADDYRTELREVSNQIEKLIDSIPTESRKLVTGHEALGYFADRYGLEVIGVVIPGGSTLGEPSSADLAALVETIRREGVAAVFAETTNPAGLAEAVADEAGQDVKVVVLFTESLGDPGSGAETLPDMLLTDARLIADALS